MALRSERDAWRNGAAPSSPPKIMHCAFPPPLAIPSGGGWSPISAGLSTGGNAARIFTTVQLAGGNKLLMGQYFLGFLLNGLLLGQSLVWPTEAGDDKE